MDRSNQQIFLLLALLLFYAVIPVGVLLWGIISIYHSANWNFENGLFVSVLATYATDPGAYTGVLHQMIVPVAAAVTAANARTILDHAWSRWLFVVPLATTFVCLVNALMIRVALVEAEVADTIGSATSGSISQVFLASAATLATYVMLLVGLEIGATPSKGAATPSPPGNDDEQRGSITWTGNESVGGNRGSEGGEVG